MPTVSYGLRRPVVGEVEHLGSISIGDIESIFVRGLGESFADARTLTGYSAREFWQLNSGEVLEWTGDYWRGRIGKFGTLVVRVK